MTMRAIVLLFALYQTTAPPTTLPAIAADKLRASVAGAVPHDKHLWRDTPPTNADGTVNAFIEIPRGERRKYEFNIGRHERVIDRELPRDIGGFPVNYGFVPQTVSYDGDPFDVLVLGSPLRGGVIVRGVILGIMHMEDEKGLDSKVVAAPVDSYGRATQPIRANDQRRITDFFNRYKQGQANAFSKVLGWGGLGEARAFLAQTHAFYKQCSSAAAGDCTVPR
jgi:inorganic pyrophosphatase